MNVFRIINCFAKSFTYILYFLLLFDFDFVLNIFITIWLEFLNRLWHKKYSGARRLHFNWKELDLVETYLFSFSIEADTVVLQTRKLEELLERKIIKFHKNKDLQYILNQVLRARKYFLKNQEQRNLNWRYI